MIERPHHDDERSYPPSLEALREFYRSREWTRPAYEMKIEHGRACQCCGASSYDARIVSDHIRPARFYWHLRFERSNIQTLCDDCNLGKGSRDNTDFRRKSPREIEQFYRKAFGWAPDRSALKRTVIEDYSAGQISAERAINFIREHKLEGE